MFKTLDRRQDGRVTRSGMLHAFRQNRQVADILKLPPRVRMHDGTFDKFVAGFLAIDQSKLGSYGFDELCAFMGIGPADYSDEDEEGEEEGEEAQMAAEDESGLKIQVPAEEPESLSTP